MPALDSDKFRVICEDEPIPDWPLSGVFWSLPHPPDIYFQKDPVKLLQQGANLRLWHP